MISKPHFSSLFFDPTALAHRDAFEGEQYPFRTVLTRTEHYVPSERSLKGDALRHRCEVAPVGLDVDQRRSGDAFKAAHDEAIALASDQVDGGQADRIWPDRGAQAECPTRALAMVGVLQDKVAARQV